MYVWWTPYEPDPLREGLEEMTKMRDDMEVREVMEVRDVREMREVMVAMVAQQSALWACVDLELDRRKLG